VRKAAIVNKKAECIDDYIEGFPTFTLNENLVHFAAYKRHVGFYPTPSGIEHFKENYPVSSMQRDL
jgi:uncharacterized protein YdhG (YjbR/CyaY superfamily)